MYSGAGRGDRGVGRKRGWGRPELRGVQRMTLVLRGKIMMTCTATTLTKLPTSGIKGGNKRLAPIVPVGSRGQLSP